MDEKTIARFWAKVDKRGPDECWEWTAARFRTGYGTFQLDKRNQSAHRIAWAITRGTIRRGLWVLHSCDNKPCVNPAHLSLGKPKENSREWNMKGRRAPPPITVKRLPCLRPSARDRFAEKVNENGPVLRGFGRCHIWIGSCNSDGYGHFQLEGVLTSAHRAAWRMARGPIPKGLCVMHRCDNRACVNVDHLSLGTHLENMRDHVAKGRNGAKTHPATFTNSGNRLQAHFVKHPHLRPRGKKHGLVLHPEAVQRGDQHWSRRNPERVAMGVRQGHAKLTVAKVLKIRLLYAAGGWSHATLARHFGVGDTTVRAILIRRTWKHT